MSLLWWSRLHGATTHFPIGLVFCAAFFDLLGLSRCRCSARTDCQMLAYWLIILGSIGSFAAVISGLALNHWQVVGSGNLRQHHLFVWPAFALIVALATWRLVTGKSPTRGALLVYVLALVGACALLVGAGWSGGELLFR